MYIINLSLVICLMLLMTLVWAGAFFLFVRERYQRYTLLWKGLNCVIVLFSVFGILFCTVLNRTPSDTHKFVFSAAYTNEFYREMLMNLFLYFPLGLSLTVFIGPSSILIALITSISIEVWQYLAGTGLAQGTDIIMNTLGCIIGAVPYIVVNRGFAQRVFEFVRRIFSHKDK